MVFIEEKAVGALSEVVALACGIDSAKARKIRIAACLHDIGKKKLKLLVDKPGKLTDAEFELMKTHTTLGVAMLATLHGELGEIARNIARWHHEHWDGNGYFGKYLCELPFYVEIVAIADVFTALLCERSYKASWPPKDALAFIESQSNKQFNPLLVEIFIPLVLNDLRVTAIFEPLLATGGERLFKKTLKTEASPYPSNVPK